MLESKHAGYSSAERYRDSAATELASAPLERLIRAFLAICFLGVLGLELWLLIAAFGIG